MIELFEPSQQKAIRQALLGLVVQASVGPIGYATVMAAIVGLVACLFGLDGYEHAMGILADTFEPMVNVTIQMLLPVYLALVIFFCKCWGSVRTSSVDFARSFGRELLRSSQFPVLLPVLRHIQFESTALSLFDHPSRSRPRREHPQFIDGENPPLIFA